MERSETRMDAGASSRVTAAGKGKTQQKRQTKNKVPAIGKKATKDIQVEIQMDSKMGSEMQMDVGATSKVTAAGKGEKLQKPKTKKKVPAMGKKPDQPRVWSKGSSVKATRRPAATYKLTISVNEEDLDAFRKQWMRTWGDEIVSMDNKTTISSVRFTDDVSRAPFLNPISTLQFYEAKISSKDHSGLMWPLHVYGFIAARDVVDYKRNIIFERERDDCQLIDQQCPYLLLTGPSRAVVLVDPVYFEVHLKVRGTTESEDQDLISLATSFRDIGPLNSSLFTCVYSGKISNLELTFGHIVMSVEAAVSMKVINGSWPDGFKGYFAAKTASINAMPVVLLETGNTGLHLADDGMIKLQRHVVCAEVMEGEHLEVYACASSDDKLLDSTLFFKPQESSKLSGTLTLLSCEIEVTVTWSLIDW